MKLMGRHALVTGADSGIGQAIAREFAREGANVVVHYHQDEAGAQQTAAQVRSFGRRAVVIRHDLSQPEKAGELFQGALNALGTIDVLVNCAGVNPATDRSVDMTLEDFQRILDINLVSPWVLCQAAARHMGDAWLDGETAQGGVILNITSVHEVIPSWGGAAYDASKAGLRNVTRNLARELARKHIRVNNIAPGFIATPMNQETLEDADEMEKSLAHIPLARVGHPDEVAHVAVFLASEDASYVTGSSYFVDGGLMQMMGAGA
jgi:glucose 1-dehydrogenase